MGPDVGDQLVSTSILSFTNSLHLRNLKKALFVANALLYSMCLPALEVCSLQSHDLKDFKYKGSFSFEIVLLLLKFQTPQQLQQHVEVCGVKIKHREVTSCLVKKRGHTF